MIKNFYLLIKSQQNNCLTTVGATQQIQGRQLQIFSGFESRPLTTTTVGRRWRSQMPQKSSRLRFVLKLEILAVLVSLSFPSIFHFKLNIQTPRYGRFRRADGEQQRNPRWHSLMGRALFDAIPGCVHENRFLSFVDWQCAWLLKLWIKWSRFTIFFIYENRQRLKIMPNMFKPMLPDIYVLFRST